MSVEESSGNENGNGLSVHGARSSGVDAVFDPSVSLFLLLPLRGVCWAKNVDGVLFYVAVVIVVVRWRLDIFLYIHSNVLYPGRVCIHTYDLQSANGV